MFLSFPPPTKMFQFRGLAHLAVRQAFCLPGSPIRISSDQFQFANPRSFSQLTTSFFASKSLGIPHSPLFTFFLHEPPFARPMPLSHPLSLSMNSSVPEDFEQYRGFAPLHLYSDTAVEVFEV